MGRARRSQAEREFAARVDGLCGRTFATRSRSSRMNDGDTLNFVVDTK